MDVLTAYTPSGYLHASTCDWPEGLHHGDRFRETQEAQGCTVRRYAMDEYLALRAAECPVPRVSPRHEPVLAQASGPVGRVPEPDPETRPPWEEPQPTADVLTTGVAIVHQDVGYAVVTHAVLLGDVSVPVARGPRGEGLVRPGTWRLATDADVPRWMRAAADPRLVEPLAEPAPVSPVPYSPHAWIQSPVWSVQAPVFSMLPAIWSAGAPAAEGPAVRPPAPQVVPDTPRPSVTRKGAAMPSLWDFTVPSRQ